LRLNSVAGKVENLIEKAGRAGARPVSCSLIKLPGDSGFFLILQKRNKLTKNLVV